MSWYFDPKQIVSGDSNAAWRVRGDWTVSAQVSAIGTHAGRIVTRDPVAHARDAVQALLASYPGGGSLDDQDALFREHTWLVERALNGAGVSPTASMDLWQNVLQGLTTQAEFRLGVKIHKGAPLYNCGLCLLRNRDFAGALAFFSEAANEDHRSRDTDALRFLAGGHPLSIKVLIRPLIPFAVREWGADYLAVTGQTLSATELSELMVWLANNAADAIQTLIALHSLMAQDGVPMNDASRLARVEALRGIHLAIESTMRNRNIGSDKFHSRMDSMLGGYQDAKTAFDAVHGWFTEHFTQQQRETTAALNQILGHLVAEFAGAPNRRACAGIAGFAALKVRNGALHKNDLLSDLFTNPPLALRLAGWGLATLRSIKHHKDHTF